MRVFVQRKWRRYHTIDMRAYHVSRTFVPATDLTLDPSTVTTLDLSQKAGKKYPRSISLHLILAKRPRSVILDPFLLHLILAKRPRSATLDPSTVTTLDLSQKAEKRYPRSVRTILDLSQKAENLTLAGCDKQPIVCFFVYFMCVWL